MIKIQHLTKRFGTHTVIDDLNLTIPEGKMTVIIGRSGEGKSLLLKQIIGLIEPTSGSIIVDNTDITRLNNRQREQHLQQFGYVFQFAALFDSLNVYQNIGITLINAGYPESYVLPIVKEKLALVCLPESTLYKYPHELSGGMAKRVGLARTLVSNPKVILYDEPTTGLDPITEQRIHELMYDLQQRFNVTSVVITHSTSLFKYADQVAFLYKGNIAYAGPAQDIWECGNPYIYQFIRGLTSGPITVE
jgi:phospholipid/cholesterol/gamma-HCH transport system ATP-binding protein